jgi:hypothetical protein
VLAFDHCSWELFCEAIYWFVLLAKHNQNDQVKEDEMGRACSTNVEKRNAYRILVGKPEGNERDH